MDVYKPSNKNHQMPSLSHILSEFHDCVDLVHRAYPEVRIDVIYFGHLVDLKKLEQDILDPLLHKKSDDEVDNVLQQPQFSSSVDPKEIVNGVLAGRAAIFHHENVYLADTYGPASRAVTQSETETVITGPHDAFTEQAGINLSLIRKRVRSTHLKAVKLSVGEITKTDVFILYIKDVADMNYVQETIARIQDIEIASVFDTHMLIQYIDDVPYSIFPQFLTSERPDVICSKLVEGRIIGLVDGSPSSFVAPSAFFEFFSSSDDYYQRWPVGTATRAFRYLAFLITISFTALYVSVTTYHYEMIPENLILTIAESRSKVPFPPVYEAFLMEVTIELLREAGARLPTKIGQTIGIVGGIVIGQAAVQAGLTSNILIIAVASSAIASFVIPSYVMSASIRLIRFGLILLAGLWGNLGIAIGFAAIVIHMCGITSMGSSYLTPVAPAKFKDWLDVFIRAPFYLISERPSQTKSPNKIRNKMRR